MKITAVSSVMKVPEHDVSSIGILITNDVTDELSVTVDRVKIYKFTKNRLDFDDDYGDLYVLVAGKGYISMKELTYMYTHQQEK
jgi:hypothetical protein